MGQSVLTTGFSRIDGVMHCEGVSLEHIAREVGTPLYVYSAATIRDRYERLDRMLAPVPHRIHYTLKANSNRAILDIVRELGAGVDVVSGGELHRALRAGFAPSDIIFGGVGKTEREIGWKAAQARKGLASTTGATPPKARGPFVFTWQMSEEITASAASGH